MNENDIIGNRPKILPPKADVIFKLLFGDERNIDILIDFLKSVLDISEDEYDKITLTDTHLKREAIDDKLGIVDVKMTTKSGTIIHIEIQVAPESALPERIIYYNAKTLVVQLKSGVDYFKLEKVITIAIANFDFIKDSDDYHHIFEWRERTKGIRLTDIVEVNTLELTKIPGVTDNTLKYDWLQFLKSEKEEEFDMLAAKSPALKKAVVELKRLSQDEEAQMLYEAREKALKDRNTMIHSREREIAINLIEMGLSDNQILKAIGLPIPEIEKLRGKMNRA
jgi:predicted transposase/invertase (TIGR01784 family)